MVSEWMTQRTGGHYSQPEESNSLSLKNLQDKGELEGLYTMRC